MSAEEVIKKTWKMTSGIYFSGRPRFEETRQVPGYSQVSAAGLALPDAPSSWPQESLKAAPAAPGQATLPVPESMASFSLQQHPRAGSATPTLSSCSTVRTASESSFS